MADAFEQVLKSPLGAWAMVVDAKDADVARFYARFGFRPFEKDGLAMFVTMKDAAASAKSQ